MVSKSEELVCAHVTISGQVQGVFFRATLVEQARRHGVTGWARNSAAREVVACLVGPREAVEAVLAWCHQGPPPAQVDHVQVSWDQPASDYETFEIRY